MIVGKKLILERYGYEKHVNRIRWCRDQGSRIVYVTGANPRAVAGLAKAAEEAGLARILDIRGVSGVSSHRGLVRGFARLLIVEPKSLPNSAQEEEGEEAAPPESQHDPNARPDEAESQP